MVTRRITGVEVETEVETDLTFQEQVEIRAKELMEKELAKEAKRFFGNESLEDIKASKDVYRISFANYIKFLERHIVVENEVNRGGQPLDRGHINEIKNDFETKRFNSIKVGKFDLFLKICDGHYRTRAIIELYHEGYFNKEENKEKLNDLIPIYVLSEEDFFKEYMTSHRVKSLTAKQQLTDPNLHLGNIFRDFIERAKNSGIKIKGTRYNTLSYIMYGCETIPHEEWSFARFSCSRKGVENNIKKENGSLDFDFSQENQILMIEAMKWWDEFAEEIESIRESNPLASNTLYSKIRKTAAFYGLVITDRMLPREKRSITNSNSPKILANQCFRNHEKLIPEFSGLSCTRKVEEIEITIKNISAMLRKN